MWIGQWFSSILQSTKNDHSSFFRVQTELWRRSTLPDSQSILREICSSPMSQGKKILGAKSWETKWRWLSNYSLMLISSGWTHHKTFSMPVLRALSSETNTNSEIASSYRWYPTLPRREKIAGGVLGYKDLKKKGRKDADEITRWSNPGPARACRTNMSRRSSMSQGRTTSGSEARKSRWLRFLIHYVITMWKAKGNDIAWEKQQIRMNDGDDDGGWPSSTWLESITFETGKRSQDPPWHQTFWIIDTCLSQNQAALKPDWPWIPLPTS